MTLSKGWTDEDTFNFWMPAQAIEVVSKGGSKGADKSGKRWIQGIASTDGRDLQGEIVAQSGIDFSYFLKHGYFNNDHKPGFENKVGQPTECRVTKDGLWVKGFLFEGNKISDEIWDMIKALKQSGSSRKVGFSIQGKVKRREGNTIKECWIQDIAITPAPVNPATWAEVAKSLSAQKWDISKSLDEAEEQKKALTASSSPVVPESLESKASANTAVSKSLTFEQAVDFIMKSKNLTQEAAEAAARVIFSLYEE